MINEWKCHICGKLRKDENISVYTRPLLYGNLEVGKQNIRHCNDNQECIDKAKNFSFLKNVINQGGQDDNPQKT